MGMPLRVSFPKPYIARRRKSASVTTSSSSRNTTASNPSAHATTRPRLRTAPYPDKPTSRVSFPRPSCSMRCCTRPASAAPMTAMCSSGKRAAMAWVFCAALCAMEGSAATSTIICPIPSTLVSDSRQRGKSPSWDRGVGWSYVVIMEPPSRCERVETKVGMTTTGFICFL